MKSRWIRIPIVALAVSASSSSAWAASFTGLGDLPGGLFQSRAYGISGDGKTVVGQSHFQQLGDPLLEPFEWTGFRWTADHGMLPLEGDGFAMDAWAISGDGSTVVGEGNIGSDFAAYEWSEVTGFRNLDGVDAIVGSGEGRAITPDGSIIVGWRSGASVQEAFIWDAQNGMRGLGLAPGESTPFNLAVGVSADGTRVVGYSRATLYPFVWDEVQGMQFLPGSTVGQANGISADGMTIVGRQTVQGRQKAVRWVGSETVEFIGDPANTGHLSEALAVTPDGSTIVGWMRNGPPYVTEPFVWTESGGMQSLAALLTSQGVDLTGWQLLHATAVSADGLAFAGFGTNPDGKQEAFVAVLPEPGIAVLLASGSFALAWRARSRPSRTRA